MRPGEPSVTARRVAAHRLAFERVPCPHGDPDAELGLARDVAGGEEVAAQAPMARYLAARTGFFDRSVVAALDAGTSQVVVVAAGYDGRAWRYARPGVRWFELDHPDTQRDKLIRVRRLGLATRHVSFVAADFVTDDVATALTGAGIDRAVPSLFLCEGIAAYLEAPVLAALVGGLRSVAGPGSRLAISVAAVAGAGAEADAGDRRAELRRAVAAMGEPMRNTLTAGDVGPILVDAGWESSGQLPGTSGPAPAAGPEAARPGPVPSWHAPDAAGSAPESVRPSPGSGPDAHATVPGGGDSRDGGDARPAHADRVVGAGFLLVGCS